jgi:hypothetical protein
VENGGYRAELFPGRAEMIAYCAKHKIPVEASLKKPYSMDRNLLHISYEAGILKTPGSTPPPRTTKAMFKLSVAPEDAPDKPEYVEIDFVKGERVAVNGKALTPGGVMKALNKLGGKHGIGRVDLVENRFVGMKSRGVYETPGRHHPHAGPPPDRVPHHGPRSAPPARRLHPEIRRARLQRLLVRPRARDAPGDGGREPALRPAPSA